MLNVPKKFSLEMFQERPVGNAKALKNIQCAGWSRNGATVTSLKTLIDLHDY